MSRDLFCDLLLYHGADAAVRAAARAGVTGARIARWLARMQLRPRM